MKKFLLQALCFWLIAIHVTALSKETPHQATCMCLDTVYSRSFDSPTNNTLSSNQSGFYTLISNTTTFPNRQESTYNQPQINDLAILAYLKSIMSPQDFKAFYKQLHTNTYGIDSDFAKNILLEKNLDGIKLWIINNKQLTSSQAINLWGACCHTKGAWKRTKNKGLNHIVQEYDLREKAELKKSQQQKTTLRLNTQKNIVQQYLTQCGLNPEQCVYLPQDFEQLQKEYQQTAQCCKKMQQHDNSQVWFERLYALEQTEKQNFAQSAQALSLSPQARGYLLAHDLQPNHYQSCYGTALQQQFNIEICKNFEHIAQIQHNVLHQSSFLQAATQCTDAAYWSNQFESMPITMHLIDLSSACYKVGKWTIENGPLYAQAMADGVVQSAWEFVHIVRHPAELIQNLSQAAWFVLDTMALADQDSIGASLPIAQAQLQERTSTISAAAIALHHNTKNSTGPHSESK